MSRRGGVRRGRGIGEGCVYEGSVVIQTGQVQAQENPERLGSSNGRGARGYVRWIGSGDGDAQNSHLYLTTLSKFIKLKSPASNFLAKK